MVKNCSQMITYYQCTFAKQATFFVDHVRIFNRAKFLLPCLLEESVQITGSGEVFNTWQKFQRKILNITIFFSFKKILEVLLFMSIIPKNDSWFNRNCTKDMKVNREIIKRRKCSYLNFEQEVSFPFKLCHNWMGF